MSIVWKDYEATGIWDELVDERGRARAGATNLCQMLAGLSDDELLARKTAAEVAIRAMGITFTVYTGEGSGSIDREWPFDIIPRMVVKSEWDVIAKGLKQRVNALNRFIDDVYHDQKILNDNVVPRELIVKSKDFRAECMGANPAHGVWSHVCGTDLVRDADGTV
jgi:uncharacterized circularly permuted ATP-grasp superfamily protein